MGYLKNVQDSKLLKLPVYTAIIDGMSGLGPGEWITIPFPTRILRDRVRENLYAWLRGIEMKERYRLKRKGDSSLEIIRLHEISIGLITKHTEEN